MFRFMQLRVGAVLLVTAAIASLATAPAWAISQQTLWPGGNGSSTFADPDNKVTTSPAAQPFGTNGPVVQFGVHQGPAAPFGRFQGDGDNSSPPNPYSHLLGTGN
jgi:hypothetical protein